MEEVNVGGEVLLDGMDEDLYKNVMTFYIGDTLYSFPLVNVLEIINVSPITAIPGTPAYVKGVINLRGGIVPVIDLRLKFGREEREYDEMTSIIVVVVKEMTVGVIVDRVSNVMDMERQEASDLPDFSSVNANRYMTSVSRVEGELVMNLDCETILEDDNILNVS